MLGQNNACGIRCAVNILCRRRDCAHFRGNSRNGSAISGRYRPFVVASFHGGAAPKKKRSFKKRCARCNVLSRVFSRRVLPDYFDEIVILVVSALVQRALHGGNTGKN